MLVYNKKSKKKYVSRVFDIACENHFYDLDDVNNEEKVMIEKILSEMEYKFNELLKRFINICTQKENINSALITTKKEREEFSYYIAIQLIRTKKYRKEQKDFVENIVNILENFFLEDENYRYK